LNEETRLKRLPDNYFGFIYTSLVLQHIAPPCSHQYILEFMRVLKPGGVLIVQVPETLRASSLTRVRIRLALRSRLQSILGTQPPHAMEMHCIKEAIIRKLMAQNGARVVNVAITNSCDPSFSGDLQYLTQEPPQGYVSKQYCAVKD
jgi:SAM-dependent methyltransferase